MKVTRTGIAKHIYDVLNDHEPRMTYEELAEKSGVGKSTIKMVLSDKPDKTGNKRKLSTDDLSAIANVLGVTSYRLMEGVDNDNHAVWEELGLSNDSINAIKAMDNDYLQALEILINHPTFLMSFVAYLSSSKQGLWKNGNMIAYESEDITVGTSDEYSGVYNVGNLVAYAREQDLLVTLRDIRRRVRK